MRVIRVVLTIKAEQVVAFCDYLSREAAQARALPGCERYELFRDPEDGGRFLLYEEWATAEAFAAYKASELFQASMSTLQPMMAAPPDSAYFEARPTA